MKKHLIEALLIIFSVLVALGINSAAENRKTRKKKKIAKTSLLKELQSNKEVLKRWQVKHQKVQNRLNALAFGENDSLKQVLKKYDFMRFDILFGEPLIAEVTYNTAWETLKTSDLLSEFNFSTIQAVSKSYSILDAINDKTLYKIIDSFYDKSSLNTSNFEDTSVQFALMLGELVGQENFLLPTFDVAIEALEAE